MNDEHGMNDRKFVRLTAQMDGNRVVANNIGRKVEVSEMELLALCNFADVGLLTVFSSIEGPVGEDARDELEQTLAAINDQFGDQGQDNGVESLANCCVAILHGARLGKYTLRIDIER